MRRASTLFLMGAVSLAGACATFGTHAASTHPLISKQERLNILRRSQVWTPTDVASKDLMTGPEGPGSFKPGETVTCDYLAKDEHGLSPKFTCASDAGKEDSAKDGGKADELKVKYGVKNAEVYGEVASTRLLWALGFGSDRMYPVRVICRGCPETIHASSELPSGERVFDPAAIERKAPGREIESKPYEGWAWKELDEVDPAAGGAPAAHRDALKLLAVILQHGDSKAQQQRLTCLDKKIEGAPEGAESAACSKPFMLISDLGLTFGRSDWLNRNSAGGANFARWARTPVWKNPEGCMGKLNGSLTGSLSDPIISEAGRQFLSDLLMQLSDKQIHDMFAVARITERPSNADGSLDDWVAAFKTKRDEVNSRHCEPTGGSYR